jgi:hypothetical protein
VTAFDRRAPWIALAVAVVVALVTMTPDLIGVFFDDAIYALLAQSIAEGRGYVYTHIPGEPAGIHYPPLWPLVLAAAWKLGGAFPENAALLKAVNPLCLGLAAAGAVVVGRRVLGVPSWAALAAVIVGTTAVPMLLLTNPPLSEPLFLALLFPALLAAERAVATAERRWVVLAALLGALLILERTIGGVVVIATVLVLLGARRWREALLHAAIVALCIAPWQYFVWKHSAGFPPEIAGSYGPYLAWILDAYREGGAPFLRDVLAKNLRDAWRMNGPMLTPMVGGVARQVAIGGAVLFTAFGVWHLLRRDGSRVTGLALAGYLAVVVAWPFQIDRFLWAIWPLLLLVALVGAGWARERVRPSGRAPLFAVTSLAVLLAVGHVGYNARAHLRGWATKASEDMSRQAEPMVRYINSDPRLAGRVLAAETAPMIALYTGQRVVPVEMLLASDHLRHRTPEESALWIAAIDRRFRPEVYVLTPGGHHAAALLAARLGEGRTLRELVPPGGPVRVFEVVTP